MSTYTGRRAPNITEYINSLNTVSPVQEVNAHENDFLNFSNTDLDIFTNAEFFDLGMDVNQTAGAVPSRRQSTAFDTSPSEAFASSDFQYHDFSAFPSNLDIKPAQAVPNVPHVMHASPIAASPVSYTHQAKIGDKRKLEYSGEQTGNEDMEEASSHAAEEDKRRRNTAASARFRVKKKQREQALEKSAKEMSDKVALLEAENQQLKMENKWLKGIIVEKSGKSSAEDLLREVKAGTNDLETKEESRKDGVGTKQ